MADGLIERVLERARWAPSGDNTQPWRFESVNDRHVVVHGFDTRDWCVYDIGGRPSQLALGALLENIDIAVSEFGMAASITRRQHEPDTRPTFDVRLCEAPDRRPDPLAPFIEKRSVQRRALRRRPIAATAKAELERAIGTAFSVRWLEGEASRLRMAALMFQASKVRLTAPEAYDVHRRVIAWNSRYSDDKVPDGAVGLDPMTTRLMAWVMRDWRRVVFFNRFLAGTWLPRLQLDVVPAVACAAHFAIVARCAPTTIDDYVGCGRAMQRFWLTATRLRLKVQPEMTPLILAAYARSGGSFSAMPALRAKARVVADRFDRMFAPEGPAVAFVGRIGEGDDPECRSLRLPLATLMLSRGSAYVHDTKLPDRA